MQLEGAKFEAAQQLSLRDGFVIPNATKTASMLLPSTPPCLVYCFSHLVACHVAFIGVQQILMLARSSTHNVLSMYSADIAFCLPAQIT